MQRLQELGEARSTTKARLSQLADEFALRELPKCKSFHEQWDHFVKNELPQKKKGGYSGSARAAKDALEAERTAASAGFFATYAAAVYALADSWAAEFLTLHGPASAEAVVAELEVGEAQLRGALEAVATADGPQQARERAREEAQVGCGRDPQRSSQLSASAAC